MNRATLQFLTQPRRSLVILLALAWMPMAASAALFDESTDVKNRRGDPSPTAGHSNVDEYTFQDEQINVDPDSGVVRVLRVNQKNLVNDYVVDIIPIANVTPREIRQLVREMTGAEGGRAEVIRDKTGKKNYVQVICPRFQLPYLRAAISALDKDWVRIHDDGIAEVYYTAKFRDVRAVDTIAEVFAGEGLSDLDLSNNSIYRWDEPYRAESYVEKGAALADIPINQVLLDVKIYELNTSNDNKIGLDYIAWKNGPGRNLAGFVLSGIDNHERFTNLPSIYNPIFPRVVNPGPKDLRLVREFTERASYGYANYLLTSAFLDFLVSKGKAKVLTGTKILARSGQGRNAHSEPALFEAVDDIVAIVAEGNDTTRLETPTGQLRLTSMRSGNSVKDQWGNPAFDYDDEPVEVDTHVHDRTLEVRMEGKTGIFMECIPHVALESCELEVAIGVSTLAGYMPGGMPILSQRIVESEFSVPNGQPIVLGGMTRKTKIKNNARMPWLGKIPIAGYLVGGETNALRETRVVFVITPRIITSSDSQVTLGSQEKVTIAQAKGTKNIEPPKNPMGFDQWLLDKEQPMP